MGEIQSAPSAAGNHSSVKYAGPHARRFPWSAVLAQLIVALTLIAANLYADRYDGWAMTTNWKVGWPNVFLASWRVSSSPAWRDARPWRGDVVEWNSQAAIVDAAVVVMAMIVTAFVWAVARRLIRYWRPGARSTRFVFGLTMLMLLLANVPGNREHDNICRHGWPWTYVERGGRAYWSGLTIDSVWTPYQGVCHFSFPAAIGNLLLVLAFAAAAAMLWDWRRARRRHLLQFTLADLALATGLIAAALGWLTMNRSWRSDELRRIAELNAGGIRVGTSAITPTWLVQWLGEDRAREILGEGRPFRLNALPLESRRSSITADALRPAGAFTHLSSIDFNDCRIDCAGIAHLRSQATLSNVSLSGAMIDDAALATLRGARRMRFLYLSNTGITDRGLESLTELTALRDLRLPSTQISDDGLRHMANLQDLHVLQLSGTNVGDDGMRYVGQLGALEKLQLVKTHVGDAGLAHLAGLKKLRMLELGGTRVTDAGMKEVSEMKFLFQIDLRKTAVTDAGLQLLEALPLEIVLYGGPNITPAGVARMQRARPGILIASPPLN